MRTHCPSCEADCCDNCRHFSFNPDKRGNYAGNGFCNKHQRREDPSGDCDDFHCRQATGTDVDLVEAKSTSGFSQELGGK